MKVTKVGESPEDKTYKETCRNCKSELEYTTRDIKSDRDGRYIECPICGHLISSIY